MKTIEQIENELGLEVTAYIRDMSSEKKKIFLPPIKIKTDKYQSISVEKLELKETLYHKNLIAHYNSSKSLELYRKRLGKSITQVKAMKLLYRDYFDYHKSEKRKKHYAFLFQRDKNGVIDQTNKKYVSTIDNLLNQVKKNDCFTPALFYDNRSFVKENLSLMSAIVFDFDLLAKKVVMTKEEVFNFVKDKLGIELSILWDTKTKGNYAGAILIESMSGQPLSVHLYEQILKEMLLKLDGIVDTSCFTANHLFSLPVNSKKTNREIRFYNDRIYSIDEFRYLLSERDKRREIEGESSSISMTNLLNHPAIRALYNGEVTGYRNNAAFTLALVFKTLRKSEQECMDYMHSNWYFNVQNGFDHKFTKNELTNCIRHAYSLRYKSFHSDYVEMVTGLPCNIVRVSTYHPTGKHKMGNEHKLRLFFQEKGAISSNVSELVQLTGIKTRTLESLLKKFKERNELQYETKRGRGLKTLYVYNDNLAA
ncbi:hypothetical protein [Lysinibacillus xylanilyticus]|uniref:hypothetical protein n=1 Tax=Lysinibacillus xylanilyticus TaxID=582475 RepID=UPI003D985702